MGRMVASLLIQAVLRLFLPVLSGDKADGGRFLFRSGPGAEYRLQGSLPGIQCPFQRNGVVRILQRASVCHFTHQGVGNGQLPHLSVRHFCHNIAKAGGKQIFRRHVVLNLCTQAVSESHLAHSRRQAFAVQGIGGDNFPCLYILKKLSVLIHDLLIYRQIIFILLDPEPNQLAARPLQLGRDDILTGVYVHREGYQRGRHINVIKGAGHTVFSSDGGKAKSHLGRVGSQQSRERLAPALRIRAHAAEIFLESKPDFPVIAAVCHNSGHRFHHRVDGAVVGAPAGQIGVKPVAHHGHRIGVALQNRQFCHHSLGFRKLVFSPVGHQHGAGSDGAVKHLHQSLLGTAV